jgi:hypothetical protein
VHDRDCKPLPASGGLYLISVLHFIFLELHVIEQNECVGFIDFVEVAKPGQIVGLMDGYNHLL